MIPRPAYDPIMVRGQSSTGYTATIRPNTLLAELDQSTDVAEVNRAMVEAMHDRDCYLADNTLLLPRYSHHPFFDQVWGQSVTAGEVEALPGTFDRSSLPARHEGPMASGV